MVQATGSGETQLLLPRKLSSQLVALCEERLADGGYKSLSFLVFIFLLEPPSEQVCNVRRICSMQGFVRTGQELTIHPVVDWQPVQVPLGRCGMRQAWEAH